MRTSELVRRCFPFSSLILAYLLSCNALAQSGSGKNAASIPVTIAKELDLNIYCGDEVEIILEAHGARHGTNYKIRRQPLSTTSPLEIQLDENGRGRVIYRHDKKEGPGLDVFYYAAQNPGATMSARAKVHVRSKERPAKLLSERNLYNFGSVPVGEEKKKQIRIRNEGGMPYFKKLSLPAPWHSSHNGQMVEFLPQDEVEIEICFRPEVSGKFVETIYFEKSGLNSIQLQGSGYQLFDVSPKSLNLGVQGDSSSGRWAECRIVNYSDQQVKISFECPDKILPVPEITLEGKQTKTIRVHANPEVKQGGKSELIIKSGNFTQKIDTLIEPMPPVIEAIPPNEWDLGIKGTTIEGQEFYLQNTGGKRAMVNAIYPSWIKLRMESLDIGVDEKISVFVEPTPREQFGKLEGEIIFEYETKKLSVNVQLEIPISPPQQTSSPSIIVPAPSTTPHQIDMQKWEVYAINPSKIEENGGNILLEWTYKQNDEPLYLVEYLHQIKSSAQLIEEKIRSLDEKSSGLTLDVIANERIRLIKEHQDTNSLSEIGEVWNSVRDLNIENDENSKKITMVFNVPEKRGVHTIKITPLHSSGARVPISHKINIPIKSNEPWNISKIIASLLIILILIYILKSRFLK